MNFDGKTVGAIVACLIFYFGYTYYLNNKYPNMGRRQVAEQTAPQQPTAEPATSGQTAPAEPSQPAPAAEEVAQLSEADLTVETETSIYKFDQTFSAITSVRLKGYRAQKDSPAGEWVELLDSPLVLQGTVNATNLSPARGHAGERKGNSFLFTRQQGDWLIQQAITVPEQGYAPDIKVTFKNVGSAAQDLTGGLLMQENLMLPESGGFGAAAFVSAHKSLIAGVDGDRESETLKSYCEDEKEPAFRFQGENIDFVGVDNHYFLTVVRPMEKASYVTVDKTRPAEGGVCPISTMVYQKFGMVEPGGSVSFSAKGYFGPKDVNILAAHDPDLSHTVDFGFFGILAKPLLLAIKTIYKFVGNYGVAIILLTFLLKMLFYPFTKASVVNMKNMQKFQPEMQKLREKYKEDPQRQQRELMAFMGKHKINPAKGCLPILPQIPVFFAFYRVLSEAIELRHAEFAGWILDLSEPDPYYVTPIFLGACLFVQQKLTPNPSMDKNQQRILMFMPLIFTVMMLSLPAGMVLYMITNTIVSISQSQWLNRKLEAR